MSIPTSSDDMTAASMADLVRTRFPGATVGSLEVIARHIFGEGDVSTAGRIVVALDDTDPDELPERLIVKVARPELPATPLYENEVAVYLHLRDELDRLDIEAPRCFGARFDTTTGSFELALEDLTRRDVVFADVEVEVPLDSIRSVLAQVARLHGAYWESPRFAGDLAWVQRHTSGPLHTLFTHPGLAPALIREQVATVQFKAEVLSTIGQTVDDLRDQTQRVQAHQATLPTTVVHGDLHVGNTYYLPDGTGGFIDWQLTSRGYCLHDVGYYLITSMPAALRRIHERDLLGFYLDQLAATGVDAPGREAAWEEYRRSAAWSLYVGWLTTPLENYGWSINVVNHLRLAAAYRDLDTADAVAALPHPPTAQELP